MIGGKAQAALFVGERIEYQVEVDGQGSDHDLRRTPRAGR